LTGGILRHFQALSIPEQNPALEVLSTSAHPQVLITAPVKCWDKSPGIEFYKNPKTRSADLAQALRQIFCFLPLFFSFFGNTLTSTMCFATPVSLSFVPGLQDLSFVDQNNR
jgi:hypothetical protein